MGQGKVLALDWGEARVGWALSDITQTLAGRQDVFVRTQLDQDLLTIRQFVASEGVVAVVLGLPYNMDGSIGPQAESTLAVKRQLSELLDVPVHTVDERLTSAEAERAMLEGGLSRKQRKQKRDALSAVLILQTYLAQRRNDG